MPNIIEIIVTAKDMTGEGFGKAEAKATGLGSTLTKFAAVGGAALAVVGYESVKMASNFDASMERLATQAGVPQSRIASLKSGVLALASQVGFSPDSLAESLYHVASNMESLGGKVATSANELNVVKVAAEGARVGGANLVDVTNALTAAVASGIPGVQNYSQAMGMLNATVGAGDMKMQDLADAFGGGMVAVVKGYGLSLKDVGAALAVFGDNNIRAAKAGTDLRMAVQALAVPMKTAPLEKFGLSADTLAKDMQQGGLKKALEDLTDRFHKTGLTAKTEGQYITDLFGKKAGAGVAVLLEQMGRLESKYPAITKGANSFGSAWDATKKQTATVFSQLHGWLDATLISIGGRLLPVVRAFGEFMLNNKTAVEIFGGVIAGLVAVLGTYAGVVKTVTMVTKIWAAVQAILNGEMTLNPIGLIVVAIAALVIGLIEAYKHSKEFRDIVHDAGQVAKVAFKWVLDAAKEVWDWLRSHWPLVRDILIGPVGYAVLWIVQHFHDIEHAVDDAVSFVHRAWDVMYDILVAPWIRAYNDIMGWLTSLVNFIGQIPGQIKNVLNSIPGVGSIASALGFAHGGIIGAAGGGPQGGGFTMVGEYGPELVRLPGGSQVYSNAQSMGMLGGGGGGLQQLTVQLEWTGAGGDDFVRWLRNNIRARGGNVQAVLGQGAGLCRSRSHRTTRSPASPVSSRTSTTCISRSRRSRASTC